MSTAAPALAFATPKPVTSILTRHAALASLFLLLCIREFEGSDGPGSILYYPPLLGSFRVMDVVALVLIFVHVLLFLASGRSLPRIPATVGIAGFLFCGCVVISFLYGYSQGGRNLFFDWRNAALGVALGFIVVPYWVRTPSHLREALYLLATIWVARMSLIWLDYLAGGGVQNVTGIRSPIYDGPTLSASVLVGLLALRMRAEDTTRFRRLGWIFVCVISYLLVAVSMRRTFWAELLLSTIILLFRQSKHRLRGITVAGLLLATAGVVVGPNLLPRLRSMDVQNTDQRYATTNEDHQNDLLDAWDQIRESPVLGLGVGKPYKTLRITAWKKESWIVHNAPLHVWIRYGLLGLIVYLWYHLELFKWLRRKSKEQRSLTTLWAEVVLAYLLAQFVVSLGFSPWPYAGLQATTLTFFLLGSLIAVPGMSSNYGDSRGY